VPNFDDNNVLEENTLKMKEFKVILKNHTKYFRELGNVIYSRKFRLYVLAYSSFRGNYDGYHVNVGLAISRDLLRWVDIGEVISHAEDPYLVEYNNTLYLFAECKGPNNTHIGIGLWVANSLKNWSFKSLVLGSGILNGDLYFDVSSPVVWYDYEWHMMFELRKRERFYGQIYIMNGRSLTEWDSPTKLFLGEDTNDNIVPDDIMLFNKSMLLLFHKFNGTKWSTILLIYLNGLAVEIYPDLPNNLMFYINTDPFAVGKIYLVGIDKYKIKIVLYELDFARLAK